MRHVTMTVNGMSVSTEIERRTLLSAYLREGPGLTGTGLYSDDVARHGQTYGRDHVTKIELACEKDGTFIAFRAETMASVGAYLSNFATVTPTFLHGTPMAGPTKMPNVDVNVKAVFTNTAPVDAYRGAGRPEATYSLERVVDKAVQLGDVAGLEKRRAESARRGKLRRLGLPAWIEACGIAPSNLVGILGARVGLHDAATVRVNATGNVSVMVGAHSHGQSHIGGSLANNDPAACYPSAVLGSGATVVTNKRSIAADDCFQGLFATALDEGEIIAAVRFPVPQKAAYLKFNQPASRFALTGVFEAKFGGGVRVAVTGASNNGVFRWKEAEAALTRDFSAAAIAGLKVSFTDLISDLHGSAAYRANLLRVLTGRAVPAA